MAKKVYHGTVHSDALGEVTLNETRVEARHNLPQRSADEDALMLEGQVAVVTGLEEHESGKYMLELEPQDGQKTSFTIFDTELEHIVDSKQAKLHAR